MWKELFHFFMTQLLSKTKGNASTIFRYTQIEENIVNLGPLYIELVFLRRLEKILMNQLLYGKILDLGLN